MIEIGFSWFALLYVAAGLLTVFGLWLYYDWRDKHLYERERARVAFHCIKCGQVYSERQRAEVAICPTCGFENQKLKF